MQFKILNYLDIGRAAEASEEEGWSSVREVG